MQQSRGRQGSRKSGKPGKVSQKKKRKTTTPGSTPSSGKLSAKSIPLTFRNRTPQDDEFILGLTEGELGDIHQGTFGEPFPRDQFMYFIQSGAPVVMFETRGKPVGYYSYLIGHDGKMHISAMVISPEYQLKGIGTRVMKQLEQEALGRGVHTLEVFVQSSNEKSVRFTRDLGFVEVFRIPPNTICFQKRIQVQAANHTLPG